MLAVHCQGTERSFDEKVLTPRTASMLQCASLFIQDSKRVHVIMSADHEGSPERKIEMLKIKFDMWNQSGSRVAIRSRWTTKEILRQQTSLPNATAKYVLKEYLMDRFRVFKPHCSRTQHGHLLLSSDGLILSRTPVVFGQTSHQKICPRSG